MSAATAPEYMLWFVPDEPELGIYRTMIDDLARAHGTPSFIPHVTVGLIGGLEQGEILRRARSLASEFRPLTFQFDRVETGELFYKCVFVDARSSPSLTSFYDRFLQIFSEHVRPGLNGGSVSEYQPHISLVYGVLAPAIRRHIASEVLEARVLRAIEFKKIAVVQVDGTPSGSRILETAPFRE